MNRRALNFHHHLLQAYGLGLALFPGAVFAAGEAVMEPVGYADLVKVTGGLIVVVIAILGTAAALKRIKSLHAGGGQHLKIVDGMAVGTRDRLVLLEVDRQQILIGVSAAGMRTLHVFSEAADTTPSFSELIDRVPAATTDQTSA